MDMYTILQILGWLTVGACMTSFALSGGFDLGAGMLVPFLGRNDAERRVIVNTVGPTWDGNQVWLITAGGALFAIWPRVYAASFSGYYFAFLIVLWALFWRPVSFEFRSKLPSQRWRTFWDRALCVGSFLPPLIVGVGVGNLFLGVPFSFDPISLRFFYGHVGDASAFANLLHLLRPFALLCGLVSVLMMLMQGAVYLGLRTEESMAKRCRSVVSVVTWLLVILFAIGGVWIAGMKGFVLHAMPNPMSHPLTNHVVLKTGAWLQNYARHPWMILAPVLGFLGALLTFSFARAMAWGKAFITSSISIIGVMATFGFSLFPFIMPSISNPAESLTAFNATSSQVSLIGILITAVIMLPVIFCYTGFVYRKMWGRGVKMSVARVENEQHNLY